MLRAPVLVLNAKTEKETGRVAQKNNIKAAKTVASIIRSCLGPRAMLKMVIDQMGGVHLTNDGNAILREVDVSHPSAKSMLELSRSQDEEVGDGTTSVIILAGEMLSLAEPYIDKKVHPVTIVDAYYMALKDALEIMPTLAKPVDVTNREEVLKIVDSTIGTKFISRFEGFMTGLALDAVTTVVNTDLGRKEIDIKKYVRVEKIPGGEINESRTLKGVMINKDVVHASMRRYIKKPRILLLDCTLEYKKGESMTDVEITDESHFTDMLKIENQVIEEMVEAIAKFKIDIVMTEKGIGDHAQEVFVRHNITAHRRLKKTDNNRIARACGATIVSRVEDIEESFIGTGCGEYRVEKIGDEYYFFIDECENPKACTLLLRGASRDVLREIERNLEDAMKSCKNILLEPMVCLGGGAFEMALSHELAKRGKEIKGIKQWPYGAVSNALEVIPTVLAENSGNNTLRLITKLRALHGEGKSGYGINGVTGELEDMEKLGIVEPYVVKKQSILTAIESACMLLRIDEVTSGISNKDEGGPQMAPGPGDGDF